MGMRMLAEQSFLSLVNINRDTIIFTLINTVFIVLMYHFFLRKKVNAVLEQRKDRINAEMQAAEDAQKAALATKAEYTERLEKSKQEAEGIVAAAVKRAGEREAEIISGAQQNAQKIRESAEESIQQEKKRALNEAKDLISEVVVLAASKVCEKEISEKENEELINSFLVNVGK